MRTGTVPIQIIFFNPYNLGKHRSEQTNYNIIKIDYTVRYPFFPFYFIFFCLYRFDCIDIIENNIN